MTYGPCVILGPTMRQNGSQPCVKMTGQEPSLEPKYKPSGRAREPGSESLDEIAVGWPMLGRKFTKWPTARAKWAMACERIGEDRLIAAFRAAATDPDLTKGGFCPSIDRWLSDERWTAYLRP